MSIHFPPGSGVRDVAVEGQPVPPLEPRVLRYYHGWSVYECLAVPHEGVRIEFSLESASPVDIFVMDQTPGLPQEVTSILKERPDKATPSQEGDVTRVTRRIQMIP